MGQLRSGVLLFALVTWWGTGVQAQGTWETVVPNAGIATMHSAVTHFGNVILLDRTNIGDSQLPLPAGVCRDNPADRVSFTNMAVIVPPTKVGGVQFEVNTHDCTAHSAIYSPRSNDIRPLFIFTDTWCSSGQFDASGKMVQTGGDADGVAKIRDFSPCGDGGTCNWVETSTDLLLGRWYASNQQLPDGTQIVVGGRSAFTVEYVPAKGRGQVPLQLLTATNDAQNDNLYPYVHLLPDNTLFIFANRDSITYNWQTNTVVKTFPTIPGEPRNYPSAGSSVLLPLPSPFTTCEVLICGGAAAGAFSNPTAQPPASNTCGRINPFAAAPTWAMETMPTPRTMGDMLLLPTETVLIINGAARGSQGWGYASSPVLTPVEYSPDAAAGTRFQTMAASAVPRMYHSTANLLPDGRVMVAGSNTHQFYTFTGDFPTELRIECFSPPYFALARPGLTAPGALAYGDAFDVTVTYDGTVTGGVALNLASAPFVTHSYAMGQRLLKLGGTSVAAGAGTYTVSSTAPPSATIAPAGYYMLFTIVNGAPTVASWVKVS